MKSVLPERNELHPHRIDDIEYRELPETGGRAVRELAAEIALTVRWHSDDAARTRSDDTAQPVPGAEGTAGPHTGNPAHLLTDPALLRLITERAAELPPEVRAAVQPPAGTGGACILGRLPLTDDEIGPTPPDWQTAAQWCTRTDRPSTSLELDIALLLLAAAAGEPFGWAGQQDGRLVNNIVPAAGHEDEQSGASSSTLLSPHTEDAFHPLRANLLMLACLRNHDRVGTTVSSVHRVELTPSQLQTLSAPTLPILPDVSYGSAFDRGTAVPIPTVWRASAAGTEPGALTLRFDPAYTPLAEAAPDFRAAYARLEQELERVCVEATLRPGELLIVDNDVTVHGRVPFTARYDGTDRWLKRVNIRLPERPRRAAESRENGYGQQIVAPFASPTPRRVRAERNGAVDDRGSVGHT